MKKMNFILSSLDYCRIESEFLLSICRIINFTVSTIFKTLVHIVQSLGPFLYLQRWYSAGPVALPARYWLLDILLLGAKYSTTEKKKKPYSVRKKTNPVFNLWFWCKTWWQWHDITNFQDFPGNNRLWNHTTTGHSSS